MAHVDLTTGKIYGCKLGSLTWWHEKGHLYYNSRAWAPRLCFARGNFQDIALFFVVLSVLWPNFFFKAFAGCAILGWLVLYYFEEAYAWWYALRKKKYI